MIGMLKGKVEVISHNSIIVMINGVGYKVNVTEKIANKSFGSDLEIKLFIHTHVKEDALELYGFESRDELNIFNMIIGVSGIGPKTALFILERGEKEVKEAIVNSDVDFFTSIPRIGKKNAQRIIIDLKSKLGSLQELDLSGKIDGQTKELIDALLSIGFKKFEIQGVLGKLPKNLKTIEEKIRESLKYLGNK